jgi:hypothetical protein
MLGFLNSVRTGLSIFFVSLFLSGVVGDISTSCNIGNSPPTTEHNVRLIGIGSILILALAMMSHNGGLLVIFIYLSSRLLMSVIERNDELFCYSKNGRLYTALLMLASLSVGFIGSQLVIFRSIGQESASGIAVLKLLFDGLLLLLLIIYYMPRIFLCNINKSNTSKRTKINSGAAYLFIAASAILGMCVSTYGSETSNRIEQFLRITVYAICSIAASKKLGQLNRHDWILICMLLISGLGLANLASPAVQANLT